MDVLSYLPASALIAVGALLVFVVVKSFKSIGPTDVGLVTKRFGRKLGEDNEIAMNGEAGFQRELLMPGLRFKLWPVFSIEKYPWVQVPAGGIGLVIAQVGVPLPVGAKSAVYDPRFGDFGSVEAFLAAGGQKGVQRPVLPPGTLAPIHPVAFLVQTRDAVQREAEEYIKGYLAGYDVETRGVYIQDVDLPERLVEVLQAREIANQQKATFEEERAAQDVRIQMEKSRDLADKQSELAASEVAITIASNEASARKAEADGVATFTRDTGNAEANVIEAKGIARAAGYQAQVEALGQPATALVAVASEVSTGHVKVVPDVLVAGGGNALDGLAAALMGQLNGDGHEGDGTELTAATR